MKLTFIRKTKLSGDTNCPSLYRTDQGDWVIVGRILNDTGALGQIQHMAADEIAVWVPADVLAEITAVRS